MDCERNKDRQRLIERERMSEMREEDPALKKKDHLQQDGKVGVMETGNVNIPFKNAAASAVSGNKQGN